LGPAILSSADFTSVCTSEFAALAQEQDKFAEMDVQLLGLSGGTKGWLERVMRPIVK
jgi:alkyl hydroperoxide reductase subunit AhpC